MTSDADDDAEDGRALLERALAATGLSVGAFAEVHMVRYASTIQRWRAGSVSIPEIARVKMRTIIRDMESGQCRP